MQISRIIKIITLFSGLFFLKLVWAEEALSPKKSICDPGLMFLIQQVKGYYPLVSAMSEEIKRLGFKLKPLPDVWEGESYGTGFFISETGLFLTAFHVIENAKTISLQKSDGSVLNATVLAKDPVHDIAILTPVEKTKVAVWLPLGCFEKSIGQKIKILGYPFPNMQKYPKLSVGIISRGDLDGDAAYFQMTAPVHAGCSGGPVLNAKNEVVGIVQGGIVGTDILRGTEPLPATISIGVKTEDLKTLSGSFTFQDRSSPPQEPTVLSQAIDATALVRVNYKHATNNISVPDSGTLVLVQFETFSCYQIIYYTLIKLNKNSSNHISGEIKYTGAVSGSPISCILRIVSVAIDEILNKLVTNKICTNVVSLNISQPLNHIKR